MVISAIIAGKKYYKINNKKDNIKNNIKNNKKDNIKNNIDTIHKNYR
jgi:hypothetical protein